MTGGGVEPGVVGMVKYGRYRALSELGFMEDEEMFVPAWVMYMMVMITMTTNDSLLRHTARFLFQ